MKLRNAILDFSKQNPNFSVKDLFEHFSGQLSRVYLSRSVNQLVKDGFLVRAGSTRSARYARKDDWASLGTYLKKRYRNEGIEEYRIFQNFQRDLPFIQRLPEHVHSILAYAFSEMLNNAIEHSRSSWIEVMVSEKAESVFFTIRDYGVGVFRNVLRERKLNSEVEAMQDLLKGKTTTAPKAHSGEGIFFTSKAGDFFSLNSYGFNLKVDNLIPDVFMGQESHPKKGTEVTFSIRKDHAEHLDSVFRAYYSNPDDFAFDKTKILVKLYTRGTIYISRSQARRLLQGLDQFKTIVLDFDQVPTVGQAFCDEIFRVFSRAHPEINFETINTNEAVHFMIERARNSRSF